MEKAQRAGLLRERFKATGGFAYVPSGKPRRYRHVISGRPIHMAWPDANKDTQRAGTWMHEADPKPKPTVTTKHSQGPAALAVIATKAPKKLVKRFPDADRFLAERKRRLPL